MFHIIPNIVPFKINSDSYILRKLEGRFFFCWVYICRGKFTSDLRIQNNNPISSA